jgi:crossover junction endodeoxyribonuclease RusA
MLTLTEEQLAAIKRRISESARKVPGKYGLNVPENAAQAPPARQKAQTKPEVPAKPPKAPQGDLFLSLPWPPTVNHYWRQTRTGGRFISKAGMHFRGMVKMEAHGHPKAAGKLRLEIDAYPPDNRRRDLDNILKSLFDALQHAGLIRDDFDIWQFTVRRHQVCKGGKVNVKIQPLGG